MPEETIRKYFVQFGEVCAHPLLCIIMCTHILFVCVLVILYIISGFISGGMNEILK